MFTKRLFINCALISLGTAHVIAEEHSTWNGKVVVAKYHYPIKNGNLQVEKEPRFHVYNVMRVEGDQLWLVSGRVEGWIPLSRVVLFDQAIDFYTQEITANPGKSAAWRERGIMWHVKKEHDKAIADFTEAIRLDPEEVATYNCRGYAWWYMKEHDKATADFTEAIRFDPKNADAYISRGILWYLRKQQDKAILDFDEAILLDPKNTLAHINRGVALRDKKEYDKAIADFDEVILLDPKIASAYITRGYVMLDKKVYGKAIADFDEAIRLGPNNAVSFNQLAWIRATCTDEKYRDGKKAVESATRACDLTQWNLAQCLDTLAAAYAEAGNFEKAMHYQGRANKLFTDAENTDKKKGEERLKLYKGKEPYRDSD